jgi:hypothetical protein
MGTKELSSPGKATYEKRNRVASAMSVQSRHTDERSDRRRAARLAEEEVWIDKQGSAVLKAPAAERARWPAPRGCRSRPGGETTRSGEASCSWSRCV